MGKFKPFKGPKLKLDNFEIKDGQLIITTDEPGIYIDDNKTRVEVITKNHTHSASNITSGTLNADRLPQIPAGKIPAASLPSGIDGSKVTGIVPNATNASKVPWAGVSGKPDSFPPKNHNHDDIYYTETEIDAKLVGKKDSNKGEIFNDYEVNRALQEYSHAEGRITEANGLAAHAEGHNTHAIGTATHAEGSFTIAQGSHNHAEGSFTKARGKYSHAEGYYTKAEGEGAHAEGLQTEATGDFSHVQGKYNIKEVTNRYAHIVGNGASTENLSNAHTLDWDGNAWYQGTIKLGGTSYDNANEVALKSEIPNVPAWAKASTKPKYNFSELDGVVTTSQLPSISDDKITGISASKISGKIAQDNLPSYVDDVLEYASKTDFPETGEAGKIYIAIDTNKTYRWSGSAYVVISETLAIGETSSTAFRGDYGEAAYSHALKTSGNPHNVTKSDLNLDNVENKSSATIREEITSENIIQGLGYSPIKDIFIAQNNTPLNEDVLWIDTDDNSSVNVNSFIAQEEAPENEDVLWIDIDDDTETNLTIPKKTSDLINDSDFQTENDINLKVQNLATKQELENITHFVAQAEAPLDKKLIWIDTNDNTDSSGGDSSLEIPTKTSQLINDSGFVTGGLSIRVLTQQEYDSLPVIDSKTLYFIKE